MITNEPSRAAMKRKSRNPLVVTKVEFRPNSDAAERLRRVLQILLTAQQGEKRACDSCMKYNQIEGGKNVDV